MQPHIVGGAADSDDLVAQGALECLVGKSHLKDILDLQYEVSAVGPVQSAGTDHCEVRHSYAEFGSGLDLAKQARVCWVAVAD